MTQPKPTAGEVAKEAVESWRNGEVKLLTENPSEVGRYFSDFVLDGDKRLVEIFKQALLRFSLQQSEELVRVLEFCDKVISEWFKHGNIEPYSQEQLALDSMRILIKNVLAAHHANQQEGRG